MMKIIGLINIVYIGLGMLTLNACQSRNSSENKVNPDSTLAYIVDLGKRDSFELPAQLDEISGHTFLPDNDDIVYCVQDENGIVYGYNLKTEQIVDSILFGPDGDYEGITNDGTNFYVLKSNGDIYSFPVQHKGKQVDTKVFYNLVGKGEYESLGIDTVNGRLAILCKSCKGDRKQNHLTGYLMNYDVNGNVTLAHSFVINNEDIVALYPDFPKVFNPSAITKRNSSDEWYILSSIDKLILITDADFNPKGVIPFSRKMYEQPEGIAFDNQGNLYISSEKGDESTGMLYKIK